MESPFRDEYNPYMKRYNTTWTSANTGDWTIKYDQAPYVVGRIDRLIPPSEQFVDEIDRRQMVDYYKKLIDLGAISPNQMREIEGLEPLPSIEMEAMPEKRVSKSKPKLTKPTIEPTPSTGTRRFFLDD